MIFYNGFNLLVDIALIAIVFVVAHGIGFRKGLDKNKPPFQACRLDIPPIVGPGRCMYPTKKT